MISRIQLLQKSVVQNNLDEKSKYILNSIIQNAMHLNVHLNHVHSDKKSKHQNINYNKYFGLYNFFTNLTSYYTKGNNAIIFFANRLVAENTYKDCIVKICVLSNLKKSITIEASKNFGLHDMQIQTMHLKEFEYEIRMARHFKDLINVVRPIYYNIHNHYGIYIMSKYELIKDNFFEHIENACQFLKIVHDNNYVHGDFHLRNILCHENGETYLHDFNRCIPLNDEIKYWDFYLFVYTLHNSQLPQKQELINHFYSCIQNVFQVELSLEDLLNANNYLQELEKFKNNYQNYFA